MIQNSTIHALAVWIAAGNVLPPHITAALETIQKLSNESLQDEIMVTRTTMRLSSDCSYMFILALLEQEQEVRADRCRTQLAS